MKYNSLNNGPLELTTEGLFPIGERVSYRKSKFRHGRLGSVYVVEDNAAARSDAARCLADMLTDDDTEVYVVTDANATQMCLPTMSSTSPTAQLN